ncbi:MAG: ribonuclease J, partial [Clostridia bacterium]|nr:ribonuclease J [Clostridia bacterium]
MAKKSKLKIIPLGGLNEIGKNMTVFSYGNDMIILDCGMAFPDEDMLGIDIVIPDFSYVIKNADKIRGVVLTHGHEDHIGGLAYLLKEINVPIYGGNLTLGLVQNKLKEHGLLSVTKLNRVLPGDTVQLGSFRVEFIRSNHSIPDAFALAIHTPAGVVLHTGDFKIDTTPIQGEMIDLARIGELGKKGVLALMSDSTNAERKGFTMSERTVGFTLDSVFKSSKSRIIVATFASNVHRIQQIINAAASNGRKVAVSGRSMLNLLEVATELGYMKIPKNTLINIDDINKYKPHQLTIITTGSQGEPMSAL